MHTPHGGTKGDHIKMGVLEQEQATFQTSVDGAYAGFFTEEVLVGFGHQFDQS